MKAPGYGFVGVGVVRGEPVALRDFELRDGDGSEAPAADILTKAGYHREFIDDLDRCEYFVPVEWVATVGLDAAIHEVGMFGNQNSVCAPKTAKWRHTVDRLKALFPSWNGTSSSSASTFDDKA